MAKQRFEGVNSSFIMPARKKLGMNWEEFSNRLGRSSSTIYNYIQQQRCPAAFKELVDELLRQQAAGTLSQQHTALPVPVPVKKVKAPKATSASARVVVRVPIDKLPWVRALLSSLGLSPEQE